MATIPTISIARRDRANFAPRAEVSNRSMGIFVVDQAPMKIMMFMKLAPFFISTAAKGKAPYKGPAAKDPRRKAMSVPFQPDLSPM